MARRVISLARSNQVAFGAKRTSDVGHCRLAQSRMTQLRHRVSGWLAPFVSRYWVVATQTAHPFGVRSHFGLKFACDSINTAAEAGPALV